MTKGVIQPRFKGFGAAALGWRERSFVGNAGTVWDSDPDDAGGKLKVMVVGHADKIRMQVRSIGADGKVWINSDSFLPLTLISNEVALFSEDGGGAGTYRKLTGTVEALGAIHFAASKTPTVKKNELYLELGLSGKRRKEQLEELGVRPGDTILMDRPIQRCADAGGDTFTGAYLDNGLGCFVAAELARLIAERQGEGEGGKAITDHVRCLFAFASHEEIGRFGSRVLAGELEPDVLIAVDVNHDYESAPTMGKERYQPLTLGEGMTLCVGAVASEQLNSQIEKSASARGLSVQRDVRGRDTGTDGMAAVLAGIDCAATSVGFPIRNMHTISELGSCKDVMGTIDALYATLEDISKAKMTRRDFENGHPRLDGAKAAFVPELPPKKDE